jgi:hypothetical protein
MLGRWILAQLAKYEPKMLAKFVIIWYNIMDYRNNSEARFMINIAELDHWTDKQETKAAIDNLIRDTLWAELPESYDEINMSEYRRKIYEYLYTRYKDIAV